MFFFVLCVWAPTQPQRSVRVQLRCCQRRRPRHRRLVADLQGAVSERPEEETEKESGRLEVGPTHACPAEKL